MNAWWRWRSTWPLEAGQVHDLGDDLGRKRSAARAATSDEVKDLRREAQALKEVVADLTLENRLLKKKHDRGWGRRGMRYHASDKTEIIRLVEQSPWPARRTLERLGIPRSSFYPGMIGISAADRKASPIALHDRIGFGTASRRRSAAGLSTRRWKSRS